MSYERWQWRNDPGIGRRHLPVCWGAVIGGPEACYCDAGPTAEDRLSSIEESIRIIAAAMSAPTASPARETVRGPWIGHKLLKTRPKSRLKEPPLE